MEPAPASPPSVPVVPAAGGDSSADSSVTGPSQPVASNDPGMEPAPEPPANGGDGPSAASEDSGAPAIPEPQPAASNDDGGDIAVGPAVTNEKPTASNDDGGDIAVGPAVTNEEPLDFPPGPPTVVACGETVTCELAVEGSGALFQVEAMGDGDVTVRATTCVEGTQVDTIVSLYDSNPSEGGAPVASNDNDASCAKDPTLSTVSAVVPDGSTIYVHVLNNGEEAGGVSLKVHCGVYDRSHLKPGKN